MGLPDELVLDAWTTDLEFGSRHEQDPSVEGGDDVPGRLD